MRDFIDSGASKLPRPAVHYGPSRLASQFHVEQAQILSGDYLGNYLRCHDFVGADPCAVPAMQLATARYEWLLQSARRGLSGRFTEGDFLRLMTSFAKDIFFPYQFNDLVDEVRDDIDDLEAPDKQRTSLTQKLRALSPLERAAMADLLEQLNHRQASPWDGPLRDLGVTLCVEEV